MSKIEYRGTLVCSINVPDLDRSVRWYRDGLGFEEIYRMDDDPDGNPLTLAEPNQRAQAS
jgi:catechol 2,3-dioxygenase-like lactoylglutathione lyase family enzyme